MESLVWRLSGVPSGLKIRSVFKLPVLSWAEEKLVMTLAGMPRQRRTVIFKHRDNIKSLPIPPKSLHSLGIWGSVDSSTYWKRSLCLWNYQVFSRPWPLSVLLQVLKTPPNTQHWPKQTGTPVFTYCSRILTLPVQDVGGLPMEKSSLQLPTNTPLSSWEFSWEEEEVKGQGIYTFTYIFITEKTGVISTDCPTSLSLQEFWTCQTQSFMIKTMSSSNINKVLRSQHGLNSSSFSCRNISLGTKILHQQAGC